MLKEKTAILLPIGSIMRKDDYWQFVNNKGGSPDLYI